jgi:hypothetical protein
MLAHGDELRQLRRGDGEFQPLWLEIQAVEFPSSHCDEREGNGAIDQETDDGSKNNGSANSGQFVRSSQAESIGIACDNQTDETQSESSHCSSQVPATQ